MEFLFLFSFLPLHTNVVYIYMYNSHVFSINPLSRVNTFVIISCRGRVVTNVVNTCDPTPLYYMQLNIIKLNYNKCSISALAAPIYQSIE